MTAGTRTGLLSCGGMLLGIALPAFAQEWPEVSRLQEIEVTGSNIRRTDIAGALPLQTLSRVEIERSGALTAADIMSHVSANFIGRTDVPFNTSVGYTQAGLSSANLRGLGDGSTLVLLNGRRLSNYAATGGAVNLNFIPAAAIDRVEILKDGASAIYGADALAGVINFILRKDFSGVQASVFDGEAQHGGGAQRQAVVTAGYGDLAKDRFNAFVVASYQKDEDLAARDRSFSRTGYRPDEGAINTQLEVFPANIRGPGSTLLNPARASGCDPPIAIPIPGTQRCEHDTLAVVNLIPPVERTNVFGSATWQVDADHQLFAQYLHADDHYVFTRNPAPSSETFNPLRQPILYPAGGPYYPTAFAAANGLTGNLTLLYRTVPLGPITDNLHGEASHAVVGARGSLAGWAYDATWIHSENVEEYFAVSGRVSASRLIAAMASGLINPFGPSGPQGDALLASTEAAGDVFRNTATTDSFNINASTEIYRLPAGPVSLGLGAEARHERLGIHYSPEQASGDIIGGLVVKSSSGARSAGAFFVELNVPVLDSLEMQLAARYDHYDDFGGTTNPKVALRWQPARDVLFRGSYGTGFRAPTIPDLYSPQSINFTRNRYDDPLRCPSTHAASDCNTGFPILNGGNPGLNPERSEQVNAGAVWQPFPGLSVDVDYWKINKSNAIGALSDATVFGNFNQFSATNFVRGGTDPAYPALPGPIQYVFTPQQNLGGLRTSGLDVDFKYRGSATAMGRFGVRLTGTYVALWKQQLDGASYTSGAGRNAVGQALPRWRHYLALDWSHGPWAATLAQSLSSGYVDERLDGSGRERKVGTNDFWDAQGSYTGYRHATIAVGIRNLFDHAPPFSNQTAFGQVMYDPRYSDPRGRLFYAKLTLAFH